jgi:hypothetical protein
MDSKYNRILKLALTAAVFIPSLFLTGDKVRLSALIPVFPDEKKIINSFISDINSDGNDEVCLLLKNTDEHYGDNLLILSYDEEFKEIYSGSFKNVNSWKVQVCDVDGDGEKEISISVYTKAKFHPVYAKRPFIYNFKENNLYPKWLGSRLSRPFDDYAFSDMDKDNMDELISIEINKDSKKELNIYKWKGFGFESIGTSQAFDDISNIEPANSQIIAKVKKENKWLKKSFKYNPGKDNILETIP